MTYPSIPLTDLFLHSLVPITLLESYMTPAAWNNIATSSFQLEFPANIIVREDSGRKLALFLFENRLPLANKRIIVGFFLVKQVKFVL